MLQYINPMAAEPDQTHYMVDRQRVLERFLTDLCWDMNLIYIGSYAMYGHSWEARVNGLNTDTTDAYTITPPQCAESLFLQQGMNGRCVFWTNHIVCEMVRHNEWSMEWAKRMRMNMMTAGDNTSEEEQGRAAAAYSTAEMEKDLERLVHSQRAERTYSSTST